MRDKKFINPKRSLWEDTSLEQETLIGPPTLKIFNNLSRQNLDVKHVYADSLNCFVKQSYSFTTKPSLKNNELKSRV